MKANENLVGIEATTASESWIEVMVQQVKSVRYGLVQTVVHDARVVQIEKTEKFRIAQTEA